MMEQRSRWVPQPFGPGWLREWLKRHQHPISFILHLVGIPMTIAALIPLLFDISSFSMWVWAALLFLGGYALQFLGHAIEGNDAGETILIKKWLGVPYVAVAPRWQDATVATTPTTHS
jgi:hypothetical protein